ncbi:MAG: hypothetical protein HY060_11465 [Proteobacteria bacterium]|nr:hypothetical protein [Pseudomonadota bacterium]
MTAMLGTVALGIAACGGASKDDKVAYEGCIASAKKPGSKVANATFAPQDKATFGYMQDSSINVRIPYEMGGQSGTHECSMLKQADGSYKDQLG